MRRGGPNARCAALFRLKAADFPEQYGHFPEQWRPKLLSSDLNNCNPL